jgi:hypothetical protein
MKRLMLALVLSLLPMAAHAQNARVYNAEMTRYGEIIRVIGAGVRCQFITSDDAQMAILKIMAEMNWKATYNNIQPRPDVHAMAQRAVDEGKRIATPSWCDHFPAADIVNLRGAVAAMNP